MKSRIMMSMFGSAMTAVDDVGGYPLIAGTGRKDH